MTQKTNITQEVNLVRTFYAPIELVFEAWTTPRHLVHWMAPNAFTTPVAEFDARAGGEVRLCMKGPDGKEFWSSGTVKEIDPPKKVVLDTGVDGDDGSVMFETRATASFDEVNGKTVVNLNDRVTSINDPAAGEMISGMEQGWSECLDKLARYIETLTNGDK
jgi:uncharacterized protein YndB with AHSA1/START domain